jgi:hypothetical protein
LVVRVGHVLQQVRQCGRQVSPIVRAGDWRCSGGDVPGWSLGCHGALVATYRCLCEGCTNMAPDIVITWFPLLLQLWSYEWFTIVWQEGNVLAGFVPRHSGGHAYDGDTLDRSTGNNDYHWSVVLQLNFNLLIIITCVY